MAYKKYATEEEREEAKRQSRIKYRQSQKGKEKIKELSMKTNAKVIAERKVNEEKREKYNAYQREWRARKKLENPQEEKPKLTEEQKKEIRREIARKSYHANKQKHKDKLKRYYENNREELIEKSKEYYEQHKAEIAERKRQWRLRKIMEQRKNEIDKGE